MNTTEILNKSLAWFNYKEKETTANRWSLSKLKSAPSNVTQNQLLDLNLSEIGEVTNYFGYGTKPATDSLANTATISQVAPQEVHFLTQIILNTLNTDPDRFHDMSEIPGLENRGWDLLGEVARYLIKQGWIEAKATPTGFLIKLTIQGKVYVGINDAWA